MYDLILTYILKKFNRFKSVLHIKKRSSQSAFCFGGPTGTSFLNFSRHKCVSFVCALKNSSVTATTRSPKESLNAAIRIPHIVLREIKKVALTGKKQNEKSLTYQPGYILLCKMHFATATLASRIALGSCPHPICVATQHKGG